MSWIIKETHSFNKYIGEENKIVNSISEAKEFKTKKEALELAKTLRASLEVLKKTKR